MFSQETRETPLALLFENWPIQQIQFALRGKYKKTGKKRSSWAEKKNLKSKRRRRVQHFSQWAIFTRYEYFANKFYLLCFCVSTFNFSICLIFIPTFFLLFLHSHWDDFWFHLSFFNFDAPFDHKFSAFMIFPGALGEFKILFSKRPQITL